jgi:hypothetical protein
VVVAQLGLPGRSFFGRLVVCIVHRIGAEVHWRIEFAVVEGDISDSQKTQISSAQKVEALNDTQEEAALVLVHDARRVWPSRWQRGQQSLRREDLRLEDQFVVRSKYLQIQLHSSCDRTEAGRRRG